MKNTSPLLTAIFLSVMLYACGGGGGNSFSEDPIYTQTQEKLTFDDLMGDITPGLIPLNKLSRSVSDIDVDIEFNGTLTFSQTDMITRMTDFGRLNSGRKLWPDFSVQLITSGSDLIPIEKNLISTWQQSDSFWDVVVGTGRVWKQEGDQGWQRASLPINLMSRLIGQVRNCVVVFLYKETEVSNSYIQCSQETSPINNNQPGDIRALANIDYVPKIFANSMQIIDDYQQSLVEDLIIHDWSVIDGDGSLQQIYNSGIDTNEQSIGALVIDGEIYLQTPQTRHGVYPYIRDMRHGVYSVSKSLLAALALLYFSERYGDGIFDELITDYVPGLATDSGWQGVTFEHAINMLSGTLSNQDSRASDSVIGGFWGAQSADERIAAIIQLGDVSPLPGEIFSYADANTFALSYALQSYIKQQEGIDKDYWQLVEENVLKPIGINHLAVQRSLEVDASPGVVIFAVGAFPTLDEAAKIALLFANNGEHEGQQILHRQRTMEALNRSAWSGYDTGDNRRYQHSFWLQTHFTGICNIKVSTMIGGGANYISILPSGIIIIRFMDQNNYNLDPMVRAAERIRSSCP